MPRSSHVIRGCESVCVITAICPSHGALRVPDCDQECPECGELLYEGNGEESTVDDALHRKRGRKPVVTAYWVCADCGTQVNELVIEMVRKGETIRRCVPCHRSRRAD